MTIEFVEKKVKELTRKHFYDNKEYYLSDVSFEIRILFLYEFLDKYYNNDRTEEEIKLNINYLYYHYLVINEYYSVRSEEENKDSLLYPYCRLYGNSKSVKENVMEYQNNKLNNIITSYDIWSSPYQDNGYSQEEQLLGTFSGKTFRDAVIRFKNSLDKKDSKLVDIEELSFFGCMLYDNQKDASGK